jgi:hypothetical protein
MEDAAVGALLQSAYHRRINNRGVRNRLRNQLAKLARNTPLCGRDVVEEKVIFTSVSLEGV